MRVVTDLPSSCGLDKVSLTNHLRIRRKTPNSFQFSYVFLWLAPNNQMELFSSNRYSDNYRKLLQTRTDFDGISWGHFPQNLVFGGKNQMWKFLHVFCCFLNSISCQDWNQTCFCCFQSIGRSTTLIYTALLNFSRTSVCFCWFWTERVSDTWVSLQPFLTPTLGACGSDTLVPWGRAQHERPTTHGVVWQSSATTGCCLKNTDPRGCGRGSLLDCSHRCWTWWHPVLKKSATVIHHPSCRTDSHPSCRTEHSV